MQLDDRIGNWVEERVDVGLRIGLSPQDGLIARRLFPLQLIICASPTYLRKHGYRKRCTIWACTAAACFVMPAPATLFPGM